MELSLLRATLQDDCQLEPDRIVLVGVSGGPDSLCLLDLMVLLGYPVVVAHVDHSLRPSSAEDADFVRSFCEGHQLQLVETRLDVPAYARKFNLSIEEAARRLRYTFLFEQASQVLAQAVAVAHTADDQVETVLMHLLRGAGISGLKGMLYRAPGREWGSDLAIVRPLLATWRSGILEHCHTRHLQPRMDESNLDPSFFRNRLRLELIPLLEQYNPRVKQVIWRMAQSLAGDHAVLDEALDHARHRCGQVVREHYVRFNFEPFSSLPVGQQRSLLRAAIGSLLPNLRDIDFHAVERGLGYIRTLPKPRQHDLVKGLFLFFEGKHLFLARRGALILDDDWPWMDSKSRITLAVPGVACLGGSWRLLSVLRDDFNQLSLNDNPDQRFSCWLDADSLHLPLIVRTSLPGERIQPLGMDGHSLRLSDFWVNKKLPQRARASWPLVWSGEQVAWVPGFLPGHPFRITSSTRRAVLLELKQSGQMDYHQAG